MPLIDQERWRRFPHVRDRNQARITCSLSVSDLLDRPFLVNMYIQPTNAYSQHQRRPYNPIRALRERSLLNITRSATLSPAFYPTTKQA